MYHRTCCLQVQVLEEQKELGIEALECKTLKIGKSKIEYMSMILEKRNNKEK